MRNGSLSLRASRFVGLAALGLLASGCAKRGSEKAFEQGRLVGRWKSQDSGIEIAFEPNGVYRQFRRSTGEVGEVGDWAIEHGTLEMYRKTAKLATGEHLDVRDLYPTTTYQLVSLQADVLQVDPGNGQAETYVRLREPVPAKP